MLQANRGKSLQALRPRIDFNADRFQGRQTQNGLGIVWPKGHRGADRFTHELDFSHGDVKRHFRAVSQFVKSLSARLQSKRPEVLAGNQAVDRASVDQEQRFPRFGRASRVAHGRSHLGDTHTAILAAGHVCRCRLGALLFHLATRAYPVADRSCRDLRDAQATRTPLASLRRDLPNALASLVDKALAPAPADRMSTPGFHAVSMAFASPSSGVIPLVDGQLAIADGSMRRFVSCRSTAT